MSAKTAWFKFTVDVTGGIATATGGAIGGPRKLDGEVIEQRAVKERRD